MLNKILLVILVFLYGCSTPSIPPGIQDKIIHVDTNLLEPCDEMLQPIPVTDIITEEAIFSNLAKHVTQYTECRNKQKASIILIKNLANIKE